MWDLSPADLKEINDLKIPCHLNLAICCMKLKRWQQAVDNCTRVLEIEKDNPKALFRRGTSYAELKMYDEAKSDLNAATKLNPKDPAIRKELQRITGLVKDETEKQKKVFAKMFG